MLSVPNTGTKKGSYQNGVPFQKGQAGQGGHKPKEHPQLSTNTLHRTGKGTSLTPSPISAHEDLI